MDTDFKSNDGKIDYPDTVKKRALENDAKLLETVISDVRHGVRSSRVFFPSRWMGPDLVFVVDPKDKESHRPLVVMVQAKLQFGTDLTWFKRTLDEAENPSSSSSSSPCILPAVARRALKKIRKAMRDVDVALVVVVPGITEAKPVDEISDGVKEISRRLWNNDSQRVVTCHVIDQTRAPGNVLLHRLFRDFVKKYNQIATKVPKISHELLSLDMGQISKAIAKVLCETTQKVTKVHVDSKGGNLPKKLAWKLREASEKDARRRVDEEDEEVEGEKDSRWRRRTTSSRSKKSVAARLEEKEEANALPSKRRRY